MTILITAGPTREPIDPVRYMTNKSSGKMGYALATAAVDRGHRVILISGPTALDVPAGVDFIHVETAQDMFEVTQSYINRADIAIFAAAVADYRMAVLPEQKIKKSGETLTLELVKNPDILASARTTFGFSGTLVGFAAETENLEANARKKLTGKSCDLIVANDVSDPAIGFNTDQNLVHLVYPTHTDTLPEDSKSHLAIHILEAAEDLQKAKTL